MKLKSKKSAIQIGQFVLLNSIKTDKLDKTKELGYTNKQLRSNLFMIIYFTVRSIIARNRTQLPKLIYFKVLSLTQLLRIKNL